jgi:hypothetical protein
MKRSCCCCCDVEHSKSSRISSSHTLHFFIIFRLIPSSTLFTTFFLSSFYMLRLTSMSESLILCRDTKLEYQYIAFRHQLEKKCVYELRDVKVQFLCWVDENKGTTIIKMTLTFFFISHLFSIFLKDRNDPQ